LEVSYLNYPDKEAVRLIKELGLLTLPAYLISKDIEKDANFPRARDRFDAMGNYYIFKPQYGGISYFIDRKRIAGHLDVFLSLYDPNATVLLDTLTEFNPEVHFLITRRNNDFYSAKGIPEVEEALRCVCVKKYYPGLYWNYLNCRIKNISSSWWQDCLQGAGIDTEQIKTCAQGQEGRTLLEQNIKLTEELSVAASPTYLLENQEIFSSQQPPKKEDFRRLFK
jgi:hypothetical protein